MPSRFDLPHLDIAAFKDAQPYTGPSSFSSGAVRERAEHGRRLQRELEAAFALTDAERPADPRLTEAAGAFVEVTLARGTKPDALDAKSKGVRSGAVKIEPNQDRSILLMCRTRPDPRCKRT
jgi:hypothetical protein